MAPGDLRTRPGFRFRGRKVAASLKHVGDHAAPAISWVIPRPKGRGLIEAPDPAPHIPSSRPIPRPKGRGLIEAFMGSEVLRLFSRRFRGRKVAASLKRKQMPGPRVKADRFRGRKVAASLKPVPSCRHLGYDRGFRGRKVAASLKRRGLPALPVGMAGIPRPKGRGLIEASRYRLLYMDGSPGDSAAERSRPH